MVKKNQCKQIVVFKSPRNSKNQGMARRIEGKSHPGRPGTKISFFEKWSKPGSEGVVGTRGPPTVPTTPVFARLLHFGEKLVPGPGPGPG